jgi:hypothetical protein
MGETGGSSSGGGGGFDIFGAIFGTINQSKAGMQAQQQAETAKWFQAGKYSPEQQRDLIFFIVLVIVLMAVLFFFRKK